MLQKGWALCIGGGVGAMNQDRGRHQRPQSSCSPASLEIPAAQSPPPSSDYWNLLTHPPEMRVCHQHLPPVSLGWFDDTNSCKLSGLAFSIFIWAAQCTFKAASLGLSKNPNNEGRG